MRSLADCGWAVTVVTGVPHYPSWKRHPWTEPHQVNRLKLIRRSHFIPSRQSAARRGLYEASWVLSALPEALRRHDSDLVLGIVPSLGGAVLAQVAARSRGVPFALLFQDLVGKAAHQAGVPGAARVAHHVARVETDIARHAAGVAIVAEGFRSYFVSAGVAPDRIVRVRNPAILATTDQSRAEVRRSLGWASDDFIAIHAGSMGHKQGLETVVAAAATAQTSQSRLRFVFLGDGSRKHYLREQAKRLQLTNTTFLPLAPSDAFPAILAAADAGILVQRSTVRNMALPSKLATYFAAGLPIVAAVDDDDDVAREVRSAGAGLVIPAESPTALLDALSTLMQSETLAAHAGRAGAAFAQSELAPSRAFETLRTFLEGCLSSGGPVTNHESSPAGHGRRVCRRANSRDVTVAMGGKNAT